MIGDWMRRFACALGLGPLDATASRDRALSEELSFWDGKLADRGHPGMAFRLDPTTALQPWLWCHLDPASPVHRVLDVGSGPLTVLGRRAPHGRLELTCCDPLARHYRALLARHGIEAPHPIDDAPGESLVDRYGTAAFDLAFSNNAVDHSEDPLEVLRQMALVVREGGAVVVQVGVREGHHGGYRGLHQWDLWEEHGRLFVARQGGRAIDAAARLEPWMRLRSIEPIDTNPAGLRWDRPHIRCVWERRAPA